MQEREVVDNQDHRSELQVMFDAGNWEGISAFIINIQTLLNLRPFINREEIQRQLDEVFSSTRQIINEADLSDNAPENLKSLEIIVRLIGLSHHSAIFDWRLGEKRGALKKLNIINEWCDGLSMHGYKWRIVNGLMFQSRMAALTMEPVHAEEVLLNALETYRVLLEEGQSNMPEPGRGVTDRFDLKYIQLTDLKNNAGVLQNDLAVSMLRQNRPSEANSYLAQATQSCADSHQYSGYISDVEKRVQRVLTAGSNLVNVMFVQFIHAQTTRAIQDGDLEDFLEEEEKSHLLFLTLESIANKNLHNYFLAEFEYIRTSHSLVLLSQFQDVPKESIPRATKLVARAEKILGRKVDTDNNQQLREAAEDLLKMIVEDNEGTMDEDDKMEAQKMLQIIAEFF